MVMDEQTKADLVIAYQTYIENREILMAEFHQARDLCETENERDQAKQDYKLAKTDLRNSYLSEIDQIKEG